MQCWALVQRVNLLGFPAMDSIWLDTIFPCCCGQRFIHKIYNYSLPSCREKMILTLKSLIPWPSSSSSLRIAEACFISSPQPLHRICTSYKWECLNLLRVSTRVWTFTFKIFFSRGFLWLNILDRQNPYIIFSSGLLSHPACFFNCSHFSKTIPA